MSFRDSSLFFQLCSLKCLICLSQQHLPPSFHIMLYKAPNWSALLRFSFVIKGFGTLTWCLEQRLGWEIGIEASEAFQYGKACTLGSDPAPKARWALASSGLCTFWPGAKGSCDLTETGCCSDPNEPTMVLHSCVMGELFQQKILWGKNLLSAEWSKPRRCLSMRKLCLALHPTV